MLTVPVESPYVSFLTTLPGCFLKKVGVFTITSLLLREYSIDNLLISVVHSISSHLHLISFWTEGREGRYFGICLKTIIDIVSLDKALLR